MSIFNSQFSKKILVASVFMVIGIAYANYNVYKSKDENKTLIVTNKTLNNATLIETKPAIQSTRPNNTRIYYQSTPKPYTQNTYAKTNTVISNSNWPSNINYSANIIEFATTQNMGVLIHKWRTGQPIAIAHFGDSHIQPGWQIAPIRKLLQDARGDGGRGMVFPYKVAKTYSQEDYDSGFSGSWKTANSIQQPPKLPVGISGFVAKTSDTRSGFTFNFKDSVPALGNIRANLIFKVTGDYDIYVSNGYSKKMVSVTSKPHSQEIGIELPNSERFLELSFYKKSTVGEFEFHGLNLTKANNGVIYHNLGVGGAAYNALIQQKYFEEQFPMIGADLTILDWGTNDILYTNIIAPNFERTVRATIAKVRAVNPTTAILLTSPQEARYRKNRVTVSQNLSQLMRHIAQSEGVLYYDWYAIAGGVDSTAKWHAVGYASKDQIHLNGKGYRVRGQLLGLALLNILAP